MAESLPLIATKSITPVAVVDKTPSKSKILQIMLAYYFSPKESCSVGFANSISERFNGES